MEKLHGVFDWFTNMKRSQDDERPDTKKDPRRRGHSGG